MRKFKFIGYVEEPYETFHRNAIYDGNLIPEGWVITVADMAKAFPEDLQEVFEEEKVQLTETEKIVLIDFLNDHFEEFCDFINQPENINRDSYLSLEDGCMRKASNLIDKIERL